VGESPKSERRRGVEIELSPRDPIAPAPINENLLRALRARGVDIGSSCGGRGTCGECRVRFLSRAPEPTAADREILGSSAIDAGWRLACAHEITGPTRIEVPAPPGELDHKASEGARVTSGADPMARRRLVRLDDASGRGRPILGELVGELGMPSWTSPSVLQTQADSAGARGAIATVIEGVDEVLDIRFEEAPVHGLAIDVGTTTLAVHVVDLDSGADLGSAAARNPQRQFGADVISRIAHVRRSNEEGLTELRDAVIAGLNELVARATEIAEVSSDSVYAASVVGNPTMLHLMLGVDPRGIDVSPYRPAFTERRRSRAGELGLAIHPRAIVETLPAVSAYVGADIVAGILATDLERLPGATLFLDVGTNGEVVLALDGLLLACSTAAGPAFEGASIVQGMPALTGAIESVRVKGDRIECVVIGGETPSGLCGTGLVSAVAELRGSGFIDETGRFADPGGPLCGRLEGEGARRRFRLSEGEEAVHLYQKDVREFQLAKAAIRAGIEILLRRAGRRSGELDHVLVAGAFSRRLSPQHLVETGFLPRIDPSRIDLVGNTASLGARRVLMDRGLNDDADSLAKRVDYVELSGLAEFTDAYIESMRLGDAP